jgi:hypothetical protein
MSSGFGIHGLELAVAELMTSGAALAGGWVAPTIKTSTPLPIKRSLDRLPS